MTVVFFHVRTDMDTHHPSESSMVSRLIFLSSLARTFSQIIHSGSASVQNIYSGNQILLLFVVQA